MRPEVLGIERRRRWSDGQKVSILGEVGVSGATVSDVARRHLLYVACTRARDHLLITGVDPVSEFLDDFLKGDQGRVAQARA